MVLAFFRRSLLLFTTELKEELEIQTNFFIIPASVTNLWYTNRQLYFHDLYNWQ